MSSSNQTKFVLDADAAKAVQEFLRLRDAEKKVDDGQRALAVSARTTEATVIAAAKGMAREYELAGEKINRATPLPRTFGGTFVPRARSGFDLQALPSSVLRNPASPVPLTNASYSMRSELAADLNLEKFNVLMERGNQLHEHAQLKEQLDLERRQRNVEYYGAKQRQAELGLGDFTRAMGIAGVAFYGIANIGEKVIGRFDELRTAAIGFNDVMRPVLSLGDNMKSAPQLRQRVLDLSGAYGIEPGQVAGANFMVQSAGSNFGAGQRDAIVGASLKLAQVTGGNMETGLVAVTKLLQSYGNELRTAEAAASKLLYTEDRAAITIDQLSSLLPDVLPAAKMLGVSYNEIAAATIVATQSMGNNEKTLTAERNMFLELNKAVDAGIIKQGSLSDELEQVSKLDPSVLQKMFGQRTIALVAALLDHLKEFRQELENIKNMPADLLSRKAAQAYTDRGSALGLVLKGSQSSYQNIDIAGGVNPDQQKESVRMSLTELGWKSKLPVWVPGAKYIGDLDYILHQTHILGDVGDPEGLKYGLKTKYDQDIAAGNFNEAYYLRTAFSKQFHKSWTDAKGNSHFTGLPDAERLLKLRSEGFDLNDTQYRKFLGLESQNPAVAAQYLVQRDKKEFDSFKKLGFGMNNLQFVDFKEREADNPEKAWTWLAGITGNKDAKKYALDHAHQAHEAAGPDPSVTDFGKYVARFGAAVDTLTQGARDINAQNH